MFENLSEISTHQGLLPSALLENFFPIEKVESRIICEKTISEKNIEQSLDEPNVTSAKLCEINSSAGTSETAKLATLSYASVLSSGFEKSNKLPEPIDDMYGGIGYTVSKTLQQAKNDDRLVVGLSQAVKTLCNEPEDTLFCVLAQPKPGDSATHMQLILLEAYCYENGIYIIKVDSDGLTRVVGASKVESCVLIQRHKYDDAQPQLKLKFLELEERLIDHCEDYWDAQHQPVIRLPDE